jgi:threonine aldolase
MSYTGAKGNQLGDPDRIAAIENAIDLRSDTVTQPSEEMRRAMASAAVGDDVYGEDPTVNRLQKRAAEIFGKEAALFVPTGCMGNLVAIKIWTHHGNEVICEERSHVNLYELASMSAIAGCMPRAVHGGEDGIMSWPQIAAAVRPKIYYDSQTALVCLENSSNMAGGTVYPTERVDEICANAHSLGLKVHLDGARIFNAAAALGEPVSRMTRSVDSVMFCLSKGLGAPVGSMIAGSREFIDRARIYRKMFGGGMRQVGVLAAAGLVALENSPQRLQEDHVLARRLAKAIAQIPGLKINPASVRTNIVIFDCSGTGMNAVEFCDALHENGIWAQDTGPYFVRLVTHWNVAAEGIERALVEIRAVAANKRTQSA